MCLILSPLFSWGCMPCDNCCFSLFDFSPCILVCRCPIIVFLDFSRCFLMIFSMRPGHVFRKPCLVALRKLAVVGLNSAACKYWDSSSLDICAIMLFTTVCDCWVPKGIFYIPVVLFLVPLIIYFPFFYTDISYLSSVMLHQ